MSDTPKSNTVKPTSKTQGGIKETANKNQASQPERVKPNGQPA